MGGDLVRGRRNKVSALKLHFLLLLKVHFHLRISAMNTLKNVDVIMFQCTHRIESDESNEFLFGNLHLTIFSVFIAMNTLKNVPRITSNDC